MGNKDNPRRQLRNKMIASGIGALLLMGGGIAAHTMYGQSKTIDKQGQLIYEYQRELVEQGGLIDQQKKQLSIQKEDINKLNINVKDLNQKLNDERNESKKIQESYKQQVEDLKEELAFKKANETLFAKVEAPAYSKMPSRGEKSKGRIITVKSTGYIAMCKEGCTGITATGLNLRKNPNAKVIAVDPDVIPLGTKVYIPGYGYAVAADTGGAIDGYKIDIHFPNTQTALNWGNRIIQIKILD